MQTDYNNQNNSMIKNIYITSSMINYIMYYLPIKYLIPYYTSYNNNYLFFIYFSKNVIKICIFKYEPTSFTLIPRLKRESNIWMQRKY